MKNFYLNVLATVCGAAIVANVAALFSMGERLAKIETRLDNMEQTKAAKLAQK